MHGRTHERSTTACSILFFPVVQLKLGILRGLLKNPFQRGGIILVTCIARRSGICIQAAELQTPFMDRIIVRHGTRLTLLVVHFNVTFLVFIVLLNTIRVILVISSILAVHLKHSGTFSDIPMADSVLVLVWVLADAIAALSVSRTSNGARMSMVIVMGVVAGWSWWIDTGKAN